MKRGRHDGAYDQVRAGAGYERPRPEFPDEQDEAASRARVAQKNADFQRRMAELDAIEAKRTADLAIVLDKRSREIGRRMIVREYERYGLTPPIDGVLVSLPLLLKLGWQMSGAGDTQFLTRPEPKPKRKTREDYEAERAANAEGS